MRKIKNAVITTIALCRRGKNGMRTLFKDDGSVELSTLVKADAQGELLAVVYAPERPDADGDFAEAEVIKGMAHGFLRDHRQLDIEHDGKTLPQDAAYVAESFLVAKGDERFKDWKDYDGNPVGDLTGAWAVKLQIEDPAIRKAYAEGGWDGVSMFGRAAVEHVDPKAASKRVAARLGKARGNNHEESDMDEAKLKEILGSFKAELTEMVKSMLPEPAENTENEQVEKSELEPPTFEGDPTSGEDLEKFEKALRAYELRKALAEGKLTAEKVAELRKALAEPQPTEAEAGVEEGDSAEVRTLKMQLFKAQRRTNAPEARRQDEDAEVALAKANQEEGLAIAALVNSTRGVQASNGMRVVNKQG
jgi:hypothetical protein